jgi:hypothetical protein
MQAKPHVLKSLNQTDFNQFKVPITLFTKTLLNYILVGGEEIYFIYLYIYIYRFLWKLQGTYKSNFMNVKSTGSHLLAIFFVAE